MRVVVLGSGTSTGVPVLGCSCSVCSSSHPYDKRTRSSIALTHDDESWIIIDTAPEFRLQALAAKISKVKAVLFTHLHADHCNGFDDLRSFSFVDHHRIPCYLAADMMGEFKGRFSYAFRETGYTGSKPMVDMIEIKENSLMIDNIPIEVFSLPHGHIKSNAFKIRNFLYATDFKAFSADQVAQLSGKIDVMVASGIHFGHHSAHSTIPETIELFKNLGVKRGFITHLSHEVDYLRDSSKLPDFVKLAYDNMTITV